MTSRSEPVVAPSTSPRLVLPRSGSDRLLRAARANHPTVGFWWGRRQIDGHGWVYCYVCDEPVIQWGGQTPLPQNVSGAIIRHRQQHLAEVRAESTDHRGTP
jgi:hypothetical protein